jgi:hypothetical protein
MVPEQQRDPRSLAIAASVGTMQNGLAGLGGRRELLELTHGDCDRRRPGDQVLRD